MIALGLILGALEARTGKDAWRNPAPVREPGDDRIYYGHTVTSSDYLRFLAANGYTQALRNQLNPDERQRTNRRHHQRACRCGPPPTRSTRNGLARTVTGAQQPPRTTPPTCQTPPASRSAGLPHVLPRAGLINDTIHRTRRPSATR